MTENTIPLRPAMFSRAVKAAAVEAIIDDVASWAKHSPDEIRGDLNSCFDIDGYSFAKELDDSRSWGDVDAELVEILDGATMALSSAHDAAVKAWVIAHGVTVPYAIGDVVCLRNVPARIVGIRHDTAKVVAQPVKPDGRVYGDEGGWLHPFEDAKPMPAGDVK